jgi:uncharacterized protein (TIGR02466 family)
MSNDEEPIMTIPSVQKFHLNNDEVNHKLEEHVLHAVKQNQGLDSKALHTNIGGWHSERDLHAKLGDGTELSEQLIELLNSFSPPITEYIRKHADRFNTKPNDSYLWNYTGVWFNVGFQGSYNAPHTHPGSQISAAYYIRTEQPSSEHPFSGRIDFIHKNLQSGHFPKPGTLILFPSEMLHWVHPYYGTGLRICLSFNINSIRLP